MDEILFIAYELAYNSCVINILQQLENNIYFTRLLYK